MISSIAACTMRSLVVSSADVAGSGWLDDSAMHPGLPRPQYRKQEDERKGKTTNNKNNPCGGSFEDSPLIANVKPHKAYKIHVATKSDKIKRTPGIVRRVVTEVARLYYATGERPGFSLKGIRGKGGWQEFTVALGPLKDSPLALAMYNVDVFMKAFIQGGVYFPQSGSSLDETRRLTRINERLEGDREKGGKDLYDDCVKDWGGCCDFHDDDDLRDPYQEYKRLCPSRVKGTDDAYCYSPYVKKCSVSEDGETFFFEPDIHVSNHGYNTRDNGTYEAYDFDENQKKYVQLVKQAINSNSELAYDLDIIHIACCAYGLVQSLPRDRVCDVRDIDPVPSNEDMKLLSRLQYGIVYHCLECSTGHLCGGCEPRWAKIHPEQVVGTHPSMERSFAFDLPTMAAADLRPCLHAEWSRTLRENFDETLVLDVALHDRPYLSAEDYSRSQDPHKSRLVGPSKPFTSYFALVDYYKSGTETLRAAYKEKPGAFTSGWKQDVFDAKEALLKLAKKKGDSVTEAIVRTRLDVDGVYDEHARSVAERRLLRAAADAAAAPPVDLSKLALVRTLRGHKNVVRCTAVFPGGRRIVSASWDKTLKVWDVATGKCVATLEGHSNDVNCVAISPDGRRIVSGSDDETLKVWDVATGECVATLEGHSNDVRCGVHCTFVVMCLRRRSGALPCFRTGGASCLRRGTRRSRCGTWRPANAWRRCEGTRTTSIALPCFRTGGASCLGRSTRRSRSGTWRRGNAWRR